MVVELNLHEVVSRKVIAKAESRSRTPTVLTA